jgi:hypothetical protein
MVRTWKDVKNNKQMKFLKMRKGFETILEIYC